MAAAVVRCTMPDGDTEIESVAAAARCRSELARPADPAQATPSIGATCSDQLLATGGEATTAERLEGRIPLPMVVSAPEVVVRRAVTAAPAGAHRRGGSEQAIQLLRTVVLQT